MRGRRIFDHVDPYLSPPWRDPPEPPEDEEDEDMASAMPCGVCDGKPRDTPCPRCGRSNVGRPVDKASGVVAAKRQDSLDVEFDDRVGRDD